MRLLAVEELSVHFFPPGKVVKVLDKVNFTLEPGKVLGIMGVSGSGKTVLALSLIRLLNYPGEIVHGRILFRNVDLVRLKQSVLKTIRGREIFLIFQSPGATLNPTMKIGRQVIEALRQRQDLWGINCQKKLPELLEQVGLSPDLQHAYPFQLSGGMQQRVILAMALALQPRILIADEPTTGLDTINHHDLLEKLRVLRQTCGLALIFISHDLRVLAQLADEIAIMQEGSLSPPLPWRRLTETQDPYVLDLINSATRLDL